MAFWEGALVVSPDLSKYAWLSVFTALATLALKFAAWTYTGSVSLLSDALESVVNLAAALLALWMLRLAAQPPDEDHAFGHDKAEYLSSGIEGALIFMAAVGIVVSAVPRLVHPEPLEQINVGLLLSSVASLGNGLTAAVLLRAARRHRSMVLEADGHHLLSDVWSSLGVLLGLLCVSATGWDWLDPAIALLVAGWIAWTGGRIVWRAAHGMLDASLPPETLLAIDVLLDGYRKQGLDFHALRTRRAGRSSFIQLHVLVPGQWTVLDGHNLLEELEQELRELVPGARLHTHLEPLEDPSSFADMELEREKAI